MASRLPLALCVAGAGLFYSAKYEFNQNKRDEKYISSINRTKSSDKPQRCSTKLTDDDQYKNIFIKGIMDLSNTIIMGPHKAPKSSPSSDWGSYVYSPLKLENGQTVIANRGWVPRHKISKYIDIKCQHKDKVYEGIVSPQEPSAALLFEIDNKIFKDNNEGIISRTWQFKNGAINNKKRNSKYVVIDILDSETKRCEYPYRLRKSDIFGINDIQRQRKRHLTYAYSLGVFGAICCGLSIVCIRNPSRFGRFAMNAKKSIV